MTRPVVAAALLCACLSAQAPSSQVFRSAVDVIAIDVQVVDRSGVPVVGLGPDRFEVSIDGRRRRVVSATFVSEQTLVTGDDPTAALATAAPPPGLTTPGGRVVILAIDAGSFEPAAANGAARAARSLIDQLRPDDRIGLFTFPLGPKVEPTLDRGAIFSALRSVMGQRDSSPEVEFHLRPSELLDLGQWAELQLGPGNELAVKICGENLNDPEVMRCRARLSFTVRSSTMAAEGEAQAALGMLDSLFTSLGPVPGRKTVVLVSAGRLASDLPGTRPNLDDLSMRLGKAAAMANAATYTLFVDQSWLDQYRAETRKPNVSVTNLARDGMVLGRWLDQFSGSAGGSLLRVTAGDGTTAFRRIAVEMSAYYLLGVEPAETDRDGRTHQIQVKVAQRNANVRGRWWVVVPRRVPAVTAPTAPAAAPAAGPPPAAGPAPVQPLSRPAPSERIVRLTSAYDRADYVALYQAIAAEPALANVIREYRAAAPPWPGAPRRTAAFALELALGALVLPNGFATDEAMKLLVETSAAIRQPAPDDPFECGWHLTAVSGLQGMWLADLAETIVSRARQRCPREARFVLARGVIAAQRARSLLRRGATIAGASGLTDAMRLYESAMALPDVEHEARIRAAWLRIGEPARALAILDGVAHRSTDPAVGYFGHLVRGQTLRALGQAEAAAEAYRAALASWPGAQSARVALMTLQLSTGRHDDAFQLSEAIQSAGDDQADPWWTYDQGDFRLFRALRGVLREVVK